MSYFKGEKVDIVDSKGGTWTFKPFTPRVRNNILKQMGASKLGDINDIDTVELAELAIKECYISAPKEVNEDFKTEFGRTFKVADILDCEVFDDLADGLMGKPAKN